MLDNHFSQIGFDYQPLKADSRVYSLTFNGRNGRWDETLRLELVNQKWVQAFKITKDIPNPTRFLPAKKQTVLEDVPPEFPTPMNWEGNMRVKPVPNDLPLK